MMKQRYLARIIIECETPLIVGSGEKSIKSDATVIRDANRLPYIPGTSIAGLIRHALPVEQRDKLMGFQKKDDGLGSLLLFTEAKLLDETGCPIDGLRNLKGDTTYMQCFLGELPIRQHVRINQEGVAEDGGKFDEEVIPAGARFCFELEMLDENTENKNVFDEILQLFVSPTFRIGAGSRSGFGTIKIVSLQYRMLDLSKPEELVLYLDKSSALSSNWKGWETGKIASPDNTAEICTYQLNLKADDFLMFSSGFGDEEADMTIVKEHYIRWDESGKATVVDREKTLVIPASSVKGAISHRTAFHYNKRMGYFIGNENAKVGDENEAVKTLFGSAGTNDGQQKRRGIVLFSDMLKTKEVLPEKEPMLNHVKLDRFTSGAVSGALFQEKPLFAKDENISLRIVLAEKVDEVILGAFEDALKDICTGMLPLGGGVNRGHGCFHGHLLKDGQII